MQLDEKYRIKNDENNFTLVEVRIRGEQAKNAGEEREVAIGYYGNLKAALEGYVRNSLRTELPEDIQPIMDKLILIERNIEHFCKKIAVHKGIDINLDSVEPDPIVLVSEDESDTND